MKKLIIATLLAGAVAAPAFAGDTTVSYNVGAASDYIWRGVSQTNSDAEIFGGADVSSGALYAGAWASNVGFAGGTELDLYAGFKPTVGPVTLDLGILSYNYPGNGEDVSANAVEYKLGGSMSFGPVGVSLTDYYATNAYNYVELGVGAPLADMKVGPFALSAAATLGKYNMVDDDADGYTNWKLAVSGATETGIGVEVGYTDTDISKAEADGAYDDVKGRAYVLVKKTF